MKLYATIESERASKGQGGNKYLAILITCGDSKNPITLAHLTVREGQNDVNDDNRTGYGVYTGDDGECLFWKPIPPKGEKQKGEINDNVFYCKNCKRKTTFILSDNIDSDKKTCSNCGQ